MAVHSCAPARWTSVSSRAGSPRGLAVPCSLSIEPRRTSLARDRCAGRRGASGARLAGRVAAEAAAVTWSTPLAAAVLRSRPSPCRGLAPPSTLRDTTPQRLAGGLPSASTPPLPCRAGAVGAAHVLRRLSACLPRPEDAGGPAPPCPSGGARVACGRVHPLGGRQRQVDAGPALPGARSLLRPPGCAVDASARVCALFVPMPPPWTHDALRVGGSPVADKGLAPCKRRQALLGATTPGIRCG
jgi:hypothetical protein